MKKIRAEIEISGYFKILLKYMLEIRFFIAFFSLRF
tara:strand:- start:2420 stop:2527 length:108 start_codon:yes stop_codon:yes gene_type:complete